MRPNCIIRPAALEDLAGLMELISTLEHSLTSMPQDPSILEKRIHRSIQSFYPGVSEPGSEQYLLVLEDLDAGKVIGTASVIARVGGYEPFYTYRIIEETFAHEPLNIHKEINVLHLEADHDGPSELGSLYLHPGYRASGLGRLLSLSRLMFMVNNPNRFRSRVIAEFRGWVDENGRSPFWDHVGRHFFEREFDEADFLSGIGNKEFIKALMPDYPIYVPLLPESIQKHIGAVHVDTEPAVEILRKEGFHKTNAVDIFDAGPMYESQMTELRIHKTKHKARAIVSESTGNIDPSHPRYLISNSQLDFKCALQPLEPSMATGEEIALPEALLQSLSVQPGDPINLVPLRPPANH
jgi:arginine N-succinyltransferase